MLRLPLLKIYLENNPNATSTHNPRVMPKQTRSVTYPRDAWPDRTPWTRSALSSETRGGPQGPHLLVPRVRPFIILVSSPAVLRA